jgi:Tfp pilus assembly protein PilO
MALDFKNLPFWGQIGVVSGMTVALVGIAWWVYPDFAEWKKKNEKNRGKLEELQTEIRKGQAIEAKLPEFEHEIVNLEAKLEQLVNILPTEPETGELLKWVKNLTDQSNLELKRFDPGALRQVEFYREFPIAMDLSGNYHDLGIFFDRISKYSRIINVNNVKIDTNPAGTGTIRSTFTATTFVYDETGSPAP